MGPRRAAPGGPSPGGVAPPPGSGPEGRPPGPRTRPRSAALATLATLAAAAVAAAAWGWARSRPDPDRLYRRAQEDARAGRLDRAEAALERLARIAPPTPVVRLLRAQVAEARGRTGPALDELAEIPDDHPLAPVARLAAGQIEARRGRLARAEAAFRATLALRPEAAQARRELVYIYSVQQRLADLDDQLAALGELGALDLANLIHWGSVRHVEWAAATDLPALRRYLEADPADRHSRLALAEALWRTGHAEEAASTLAPLPEDDPDARAARARMALDRGEREVVTALLAGPPEGHPGLARLRGRVALARGDAAEAARQFRLALAADPHDRATTFSLAAALAAAGEPEAAAPLHEALRRHDELGALLIRARSPEGQADPSLPRLIGLACARAGRRREARAWLGYAIARDPLDREAQRGLHELEAADRPDRVRAIR